MTVKKNTTFLLNAVIGFLSLLLAILLFALTSRVVFPRIQNERTNKNNQLISKVIQVEVLNGCGVSGVANKFTSVLRKDGFDVVQIGNFNTFNVEHTMVIDRSGNIENAKRVAKALGINPNHVIQEVSPNYYLDATVVIGSDYENLKTN